MLHLPLDMHGMAIGLFLFSETKLLHIQFGLLLIWKEGVRAGFFLAFGTY